MKKLLCLLGCGLMLCAGCANRYKITLSNGSVITTTSKPKENKATSAYHFKDANGKPKVLPKLRVREIEPL